MGGGVYTTAIPIGIITGTTLEFKRHYKVEFGPYCQTGEENSQAKTILENTKGVICLIPSNNTQGGYKLLFLKTTHVGYTVKTSPKFQCWSSWFNGLLQFP